MLVGACSLASATVCLQWVGPFLGLLVSEWLERDCMDFPPFSFVSAGGDFLDRAWTTGCFGWRLPRGLTWLFASGCLVAFCTSLGPDGFFGLVTLRPSKNLLSFTIAIEYSYNQRNKYLVPPD
ncbi:hypothetical protein SUGI_0073880 [Cryptomeria japonica]|nr:hypothetical protein SUGI_0073880 [Cryptomeria japonica]